MKTKDRHYGFLFLGFALFLLIACNGGKKDKGNEMNPDSLAGAKADSSGRGEETTIKTVALVESNGKICDPEDYDLECLKSDETALSDEILDIFGDFKETLVKAQPGEVTDERQDEYGDEAKKEITKENPIIRDHPQTELLEGIMYKLLRMRKNATGIDYNIYVIDADYVNAFTIGGEIFVTNTLLEQAESEDEIACVIGHEIGHNELGHLADNIKEIELAEDIFGEEFGREIAAVGKLFTIGFNQKKEAQSDLYGIDLAISSGYNACRGIDFWKRMSKEEPEANELDNFMRSHPYSEKRMKCYRDHLAAEHNKDCPL